MGDLLQYVLQSVTLAVPKNVDNIVRYTEDFITKGFLTLGFYCIFKRFAFQFVSIVVILFCSSLRYM